MRRTLLILSVSAVLAAQASAQTTDPIKGSTAVKGEISVLTNKGDVMKGLIPVFEKLYPNVKVNLIAVGAGDGRTKITTLASANQMPADVIHVEGRDLEFFVRRFPNMLQEITPWAKKYSKSFPANQIQEGTINGKLYGLPIDNSSVNVWYRADMFKKAGINPSSIKTWDDYIAAGKKLQAALPDVKFGTVNAFKDDELVRYLLQQTTGGTYFNKDGDIILNTPAAQKAYGKLKEMWDAKLMMDWSSIDQLVGTLKANKVATYIIPGFWGDLLQVIAPEQKGLWGTFPMPGFTKPQPVDFGTSFFTIAKQSKSPLAAQAFTEWYATVGGQKRGQAVNTMNAYLPGMDKLNLKNPYFVNANYASPFLLAQKSFTYKRYTSDYNTANQISMNAQAAILNGAGVAATLDKAAKDLANQTGRTIAK